MSLKTFVNKNGQELVRCGLFAVKGRIFEKIIERQMEVISRLDEYVAEEN